MSHPKLGPLRNLQRHLHITSILVVSIVTIHYQKVPTAAKNNKLTVQEAWMVAAFLFAILLYTLSQRRLFGNLTVNQQELTTASAQ